MSVLPACNMDIVIKSTLDRIAVRSTGLPHEAPASDIINFHYKLVSLLTPLVLSAKTAMERIVN